MAQCTARTAQSNWMSVTGHHRCYEYKKERGRCVPKDAKPARGCYNDPDGCEAFGTPERTPERTPKTGLCLTTTADFAAAIGMGRQLLSRKEILGVRRANPRRSVYFTALSLRTRTPQG